MSTSPYEEHVGFRFLKKPSTYQANHSPAKKRAMGGGHQTSGLVPPIAYNMSVSVILSSHRKAYSVRHCQSSTGHNYLRRTLCGIAKAALVVNRMERVNLFLGFHVEAMVSVLQLCSIFVQDFLQYSQSHASPLTNMRLAVSFQLSFS